VRLVADANVLLASVLGGRSRLVLLSPQVEQVLTTELTIAEVREYAGLLARKKKLSADLVLLAIASLPVTIVAAPDYAASLREARRRIGRRDPEDVPVLALALQFGIAVWSNDKDFEDTGVDWFTTETLLGRLGLIR
jgi:predicted nucleic acid-binding protein